MIHVVAFIVTQPGQRAALLEQFHALMPSVHAEEGCIEYGPAVDAEGFGGFQKALGPDSFVVIEKWASAEALRAHAAAPHMAEYGKRTKAMIASRIIHVLQPA